MALSDFLGKVGGYALAPVTGLISYVRHARMFHPEGIVYEAKIEPLSVDGVYGELARELSGLAIVRLSTAWWRGGKEWLDVLGCAIRFLETPRLSTDAERGDQDLLFATIRSPWTTLFAPLTTKQRDFLANDYYAVSPFFVRGVGKVKWRLMPRHVSAVGKTRRDKIEYAVSQKQAQFILELRHEGYGRGRWIPIVMVELVKRAEMNQTRLRFSPYRTGKGIAPRGFVHSLRIGAYRSSQAARPH